MILSNSNGPDWALDRVGRGEYFLLENRQRLGFDQHLYAEGLLVWQIDPDWVAQRWGGGHNSVNGDAHMGVWLRQADFLALAGHLHPLHEQQGEQEGQIVRIVIMEDWNHLKFMKPKFGAYSTPWPKLDHQRGTSMSGVGY